MSDLQTYDLTQLPPALRDPILIQQELGKRSLVDFVRMAWHILEPADQYMHNWHIDVICEHLEAISHGELLRLLINQPPRTMKSLLCNVFWPAWDWIETPSRRWLTASYAQDLSTRDSLKMRRLIESKWYQERWGDKFKLVGDQNVKSRYDNDKTGARLATTTNSIGTGEGGHIQILDDPHNVLEAESDTVRERTVRWLDETMSTRFNNLKKPRRVLIMQRVHDRDCSGHVLVQGGYTHICLPMRYEPIRAYSKLKDGTKNKDYVPPTILGFEDPREEEGELLWEERISDEVEDPVEEATLKDLESKMGVYATASQHQQRPTPRGGGMIKRVDLQVMDEIPKGVKLRVIRSWDYAGTDPEKQANTSDPAFTCGVLMGATIEKDPDIYIMHCIRFREDPGPRDLLVKSIAEMDGRRISIWIEQEPGSSGKSVIHSMRSLLFGYAVNPPRPDPMPTTKGAKEKKRKEAGVPTGNKVQRAEPFATHTTRRKVYILRGEWNQSYIEEITTFPHSAKADQMDATSQAFLRLSERKMSVAEAMALSNYTSGQSSGPAH